MRLICMDSLVGVWDVGLQSGESQLWGEVGTDSKVVNWAAECGQIGDLRQTDDKWVNQSPNENSGIIFFWLKLGLNFDWAWVLVESRVLRQHWNTGLWLYKESIFLHLLVGPPRGFIPLLHHFFLGAAKRLYNWLCPLVGWLVGLSVCNAFVQQSTRRTLLAYLALLF